MFEKKLSVEEYMNLPYSPTLLKSDGQYHLHLSELNLTGSGTSIQEALTQLEEQKKEFFKNVVSRSLHSVVTSPKSMTTKSKRKAEVQGAALRAAVFSVVFLAAAFAAVPIFSSYLKWMLNSQSSSWIEAGIRLPKALNKKIQDAPPEKVQELKTEWSALRESFCAQGKASEK